LTKNYKYTNFNNCKCINTLARTLTGVRSGHNTIKQEYEKTSREGGASSGLVLYVGKKTWVIIHGK
jgi:hypothetical protein